MADVVEISETMQIRRHPRLAGSWIGYVDGAATVTGGYRHVFYLLAGRLPTMHEVPNA